MWAHADTQHKHTCMWVPTDAHVYMQTHVCLLSSLFPDIMALSWLPPPPMHTQGQSRHLSADSHPISSCFQSRNLASPPGCEVFWGKNGSCSSLGQALSAWQPENWTPKICLPFLELCGQLRNREVQWQRFSREAPTAQHSSLCPPGICLSCPSWMPG